MQNILFLWNFISIFTSRYAWWILTLSCGGICCPSPSGKVVPICIPSGPSGPSSPSGPSPRQDHIKQKCLNNFHRDHLVRVRCMTDSPGIGYSFHRKDGLNTELSLAGGLTLKVLLLATNVYLFTSLISVLLLILYLEWYDSLSNYTGTISQFSVYMFMLMIRWCAYSSKFLFHFLFLSFEIPILLYSLQSQYSFISIIVSINLCLGSVNLFPKPAGHR